MKTNSGSRNTFPAMSVASASAAATAMRPRLEETIPDDHTEPPGSRDRSCC